MLAFLITSRGKMGGSWKYDFPCFWCECNVSVEKISKP